KPAQRFILADADWGFDLDSAGIHATPFRISYPTAVARSTDARNCKRVTLGASRLATRSHEGSGASALRSGDLNDSLHGAARDLGQRLFGGGSYNGNLDGLSVLRSGALPRALQLIRVRLHRPAKTPALLSPLCEQ